MAENEQGWPAGSPCWVDIMVKNLRRSQAFYSTVLGWNYTVANQNSGYTNALVSGEQVAGMSPVQEESGELPTSWQVYLATDDLDALSKKAVDAGAEELVVPMRVGPLGRMAIWIDPTGTTFGGWETGQHSGFSTTAKNGAVAWCDLMCDDYQQAREFYAAVFDYSYSELTSVDRPYVLFTPPGSSRPAGGLGKQTHDMPQAWTVVFRVDDVDHAAERVTQAGGTVIMDPFDIETGRLGMAQGPDGEFFSIYTPSSEAEGKCEPEA